MSYTRSLYERVFHAIGFEAIALIICAPALSHLMGLSLAHAGAFTFALSFIAMVWNIIFNIIFDRISNQLNLIRTFTMRVAHALLFELGLVAIVVPLAAWWLDISYVEAFILDIGLLLFFLPYTLFYNWGYDSLRKIFLKTRSTSY
ncbi:MAG: multidrug/biocide efflux PACE transporter [Ottowia sp.]|nr:multidrug/biocide efflux PACE transporter [Ottowia sp.]